MNAIAGRNDGKIVAVACWDGLVLAFLAGVKRRGCWVLGAGCWVLGAGCWVLGAGCCAQHEPHKQRHSTLPQQWRCDALLCTAVHWNDTLHCTSSATRLQVLGFTSLGLLSRDVQHMKRRMA